MNALNVEWEKGRTFEIKGLMDKPRGPKTKSRRTQEVERRTVDLRFRNPERDMYDFLGLDALPRIELNKIAAVMAMTSIFCARDCLKHPTRVLGNTQ